MFHPLIPTLASLSNPLLNMNFANTRIPVQNVRVLYLLIFGVVSASARAASLVIWSPLHKLFAWMKNNFSCHFFFISELWFLQARSSEQSSASMLESHCLLLPSQMDFFSTVFTVQAGINWPVGLVRNHIFFLCNLYNLTDTLNMCQLTSTLK